ncbi:hypothetical protein L596_002541 [Steinernema carpocapsae]|uniref:Uncharacterized protein n=1 Tax=Steinernema carpocapsae TaxID=34508 RepID=A0A4U8UPW6_STECR|nr:hypothetical protein L596_002541 [Steinernema carpocapsae]
MKHMPSCSIHSGDVSFEYADGYARSAHAAAGQASPPPHNVSPPPLQLRNNYTGSLSRQASVNGIVNQDPSALLSPTHDHPPPSDDSAASGTNVVVSSSGAIDNKIEQAMDLVKSHLTFAVREEVEVLKSHIGELEAKVSELETQNHILRKFAPPEVLANLQMLISQQRTIPAQFPQLPNSQIPHGLILHTSVQQAPPGAKVNANSSSTGGSPKGYGADQQNSPPSMIPKLNRPSGIPVPTFNSDNPGIARRSPDLN